MAGLDEILKALPIDDIAAQLGVEPSEARRAVEEGGATILSGLQRNAQTPEGAAAIEKALGTHGGEVTGGKVDLNALSTDDGEKILGHIFGGQEQAVAQRLTEEPKTAGIDFGKLLPILAPIIMGLIANQQKGKASDAGRVRRRRRRSRRSDRRAARRRLGIDRRRARRHRHRRHPRRTPRRQEVGAPRFRMP